MQDMSAYEKDLPSHMGWKVFLTTNNLAKAAMP